LHLWQQYYKKDKCGLSWQILKEHAATFAEEQKQSQPEKYASFNASSGWLSNVLKRNNFVGMSLHGKAAEADKEECQIAINKFRKKLQEKIECLNIPQSRVYNADQTGLFFQKLPNQLYADKNAMRTTHGVKQMKSKECITLMVAIAADGSKVPLMIVGKA